jgi:hypothetical protein
MTCGADCDISGPCVNFAMQAQTPVTLDSLANQTDEARAGRQRIRDSQDLNGTWQYLGLGRDVARSRDGNDQDIGMIRVVRSPVCRQVVPSAA